jgi:hypothetical protein
MPDLQRQINDRVAAFVADVTEIARQAAMETLSQALHNGGGVSARGSVSPYAQGAAAPRIRGGKRTPQELEQTASALFAHIEAHPGQRMEEIARALGSTTRDLALPVKKLLAERRIRTEGQKRATKYFPSGGARPGARVARRPGRPAGKRRGRKSK